MQRLFSLFKSKPRTSPELSSYGLEVSGVSPEVTEQVIQWLIFSLIQAEYFGEAHLFWLDDQADPTVTREQQRLAKRHEPIFLYRCSDRTPPPPDGFYWRIMGEHKSMKIYQLEVKEAD